MTTFSLRLSHKILLIGMVGILGLAVFGGIYLSGSASQEASRTIAEDAHRVSVLNDKLGRDLLDARRAEKDFLLRRDEGSAKRHASLTADINSDIDRLGASVKTAGFVSLSDKVAALAQGFGDYRKQFSALEQNETKLGLNEKLGLSGALRDSVHDIEAKLTQVDNSKLAAGMLMMRRHEKDFMLRRDRAYLDQFEKSANEFAKAMRTSDLAVMKAEIEGKLQKYRADFIAWVDGAQQSARRTRRDPLCQDPWHGASALAHRIAGAASYQGRRHRARQQTCQDGMGDDGLERTLQGTRRSHGVNEITPDMPV
ncbi:hypothetical protein [Bradyrhizobium sp. 18BD]